MYRNVYAMGLIPDEELDADGATTFTTEVEKELNDIFGGSAPRIEVEVDGDHLRVYMVSSEPARALDDALTGFQVIVNDLEFVFDTYEVE
jgi:hypothetical protein